MSGAADTPMFRQYRELKALCPGAVLFFRMGDFYEMFFEDAELAARVLEITLTSRNKGDDDPIPMAGVPHHAADGYIQRMLEAGHKVAIAEQVEDPALAKGLVRRDIVRVVTPGVVLDPAAVAAGEHTYLVAALRRRATWGVAFLDVTTGDLRVTTVSSEEEVADEVLRIEPREYLLGPGIESDGPVSRALDRLQVVASEVESEAWSHAEALREVRDTLGVATLRGFGLDEDSPSVDAAGAMLRYARDTMGSALRNVHVLRPYQVGGFMVVDDTTRRNLEINRTLLDGRRRGSLVGLLDRTSTAMGSRMLREWLSFPLLDVTAIQARHAAVARLLEESELRQELRASLREVADVERIGARVAQGTAHARDLSALRRSLQAIPTVLAACKARPPLDQWVPQDLGEDVAAELARTLVDDPPLALTEGGLFRAGVSDELDELNSLALDGMAIIGRMEREQRERTGIGTLKVKRNKVFGYFIEVTNNHLSKVPDDFIRKQTLTNCERYITPELKELEERVLGADERRKSLEYELFTELREWVSSASPRLGALADALARLDTLTALAEVAERQRWIRPQVDLEEVLDIAGGRHPVVEALLESERFVPNDVYLDTSDRRLVVLTGPNMSGKSTIMRQVALIVLLAQVGSFVPADRATVGLCDRIFTRVGAADHLTRGQSTFMVEMAETATILHHATRRSLVILDEIGRGTSTYDGLSIAWSVAEDLASRVQCRTMFATHYHELCELAELQEGVANQSIAAREYGEDIVFLRKLKEGGTSRSYGIQCARLAGLPRPVVARARLLLTRFEKHAPRNERRQMSLFGTMGAPGNDEAPSEVKPDPLRQYLMDIEPDTMTPRQALDALYLLRTMVESGELD